MEMGFRHESGSFSRTAKGGARFLLACAAAAALALCWCACMAQSAYAGTATTTWKNGLEYTLDTSHKTATLSDADDDADGFPTDGTLSIPESVYYNGAYYRLTALGKGCLGSCSSLKNIIVPNSVTSLGEGCFSSCSALRSVSIPTSVTSLPKSCFYRCSSLNFTIPNHIASLGESCFESCGSLEEMSIPSSIKSLPDSCFYECEALRSVSIPNSVTSLGDECFKGCGALKSINIPSSITSLPADCFYWCSALESITIPSSVTSLGGGCFAYCSALTSIAVPANVTSIGGYCFAWCDALQEIVFKGNAVKSCGSGRGILWFETDPAKYVFEKTMPAAVKDAFGLTQNNSYYRVKFIGYEGDVLKQVDVAEKDCPYTGVDAPGNVPASAKSGAFVGWSSNAYKKITNSGATIRALYENSPSWTRLAGNTAIGTMRAIVNAGWSSSEWAIVATTGGYYDALSASGLAGLLDCPILMTASDKLSNATATLLKNKKVKNVIVVGGTSAVSAGVFNQIKALGVGVERVAGNTAIGTANAIYERGKKVSGGWGKDAVVATSGSYQDALSIAPYAYAKKAPIFLARGNSKTAGTLTASTLSKLRAGKFTRTIITGGTAAVSSAVDRQVSGAKRLAGNTAYGTCRQIADFCLANGMNATHAGVATGRSYQDALAGAALCGKNKSILVLADDRNSSTVGNVLAKQRYNLRGCYIFGGTSAVSKGVAAKIETASYAGLE